MLIVLLPLKSAQLQLDVELRKGHVQVGVVSTACVTSHVIFDDAVSWNVNVSY